MATLESLSDDVLWIIFHDAPHEDLLAVAKVSKHLHRSATPLIYRYVHLWEKRCLVDKDGTHLRPPDMAPDFPDWKNAYHQCMGVLDLSPRRDTRIFRLPLFLRTISESEYLRHCVTAASFQSRTPGEDDTVLATIELLSPSTRLIHFAPEKCLFDPLTPPWCPIATSLQIHLQSLPHRSDHTEKKADKSKLYVLFSDPRLESLSVSVRVWERFIDCATPQWAQTSDVTCLSFSGGMPFDRDLAEMVTWPKALKSFRCELTDDFVQHIVNYGMGANIGSISAISPRKISDALGPQRSYLEELFIRGHDRSDMRNIYARTDQPMNLRHFTNLQRIGLPLDSFLTVLKRHAARLGTQVSDYPSIHELLPTSLRELQLELSNIFPSEIYFGPKWRGAMDSPYSELNGLLCRIARNKASSYPKLHTLVVWQPSPKSLALPTQMAKLSVDDAPGTREILVACANSSIQFSWGDGTDPPLFSV